MAELAPITDLVEEFAKDTRAVAILREFYERRPAIMVGEVLAKLKRFEHPAYREYDEPTRREPRSLKNHPVQPLSRR